MPLSEVSARFFLELALGLWFTLVFVDRRALGPGFTRLMAAFVLAALVPAWLLAQPGDGGTPWPAGWLGVAFGAAAAGALLLARRGRERVESALVVAGCATGLGAMLVSVHAQLFALGPSAVAAAPLLLVSSVGSMLVLGLVTGAMILGHWYLVTPDLPVQHLGRVTKLALLSTYAKAILLGATIVLFSERFSGVARSFWSGMVGGDPSASFQSQLDFLWLLARVLIGLVGPAALCHMTLATVRLKATQPATGILYAATVMVLMGELFAFVGEPSFAVVL